MYNFGFTIQATNIISSKIQNMKNVGNYKLIFGNIRNVICV